MLWNQCIEKDHAYPFAFVANCNWRPKLVIPVQAARRQRIPQCTEFSGIAGTRTLSNNRPARAVVRRAGLPVIFNYKKASILTARIETPIKNARPMDRAFSYLQAARLQPTFT